VNLILRSLDRWNYGAIRISSRRRQFCDMKIVTLAARLIAPDFALEVSAPWAFGRFPRALSPSRRRPLPQFPSERLRQLRSGFDFVGSAEKPHVTALPAVKMIRHF
jgi:hypothetical protein